MGFRFRKSIRIAPGIRLNLGTKGVSVSAGVRGASVTVGPTGTYGNVGLPGTGISYRSRLDGGSRAIQSQAIRQQRLERQQIKLDQERARQEALSKVKLSLDKESGAVSIVNAHGEELSQRDLKLVWEQKEQSIADWLEREAEEINGDIELLSNIHHDTPPPDTEPEYEIEPYPAFLVPSPILPNIPPQPEPIKLPPLNFFLHFFQHRREQQVLRQQKFDEDHASNMAEWRRVEREIQEKYQLKVLQHKEALKRWQAEELTHQNVQQSYKASFAALIRSDTDTMERLLEEELNSLIWPRETLVSYEFADNGKEVWLDVDLPEIEHLPQRVASLHSSGKRLVIKDKSQKQLQLEYARHIFGVAFRLVGTVLAMLPGAVRVVISGYSQRLSPATGSVVDEYLYSINVDRASFSKINFNALDQVNPVEAMRLFDCRLKLSATGVFKGIEPFVPA